LAYKKQGMVNWCPSCQTVLANEQVVEGLCERCEAQVVQKELEQWYFKITQYKDELIKGLSQVDWPEATKQQQLNWIGRSEGAEIDLQLKQDLGALANTTTQNQHTQANTTTQDQHALANTTTQNQHALAKTTTQNQHALAKTTTQNQHAQANTTTQNQHTLTCFTTRLDTVFGITFLVISPEKFQQLNLIQQVSADRQPQVEKYLNQAFKKTEEERRIGEKDKTGVNTGLTAINPVNQEEVPIFVGDYVLGHVGTGMVMGVPAHDERDWLFAKKHQLKIRPVIKPVTGKVMVDGVEQDYAEDQPQVCTAEYGIMINADASQVNGQNYSGLTSQQGKEQLLKDFPKIMRPTVNYKLRDWLISRQRYWGAPIPVIYDPDNQPHAIKDKDLPWLLPTDVDFKPTGESPLKSSAEFLERTQDYASREFAQLIKEKGWPANGKGWQPEFDTMDTFVDSSWYYLRYLDARNPDQFADPKRLNQFMPVDFYLIGPEHIVLHLLYSRFFTKFLRDQEYLDLPSGEPFAKMRHQGMILGPDHKKMSKSKGNVINPDVIIKKYGADTLRVYEMFIGPFEADKPWDDRAVQGVFRFLHKLYDLTVESLRLTEPENSEPQLVQKLHAVIQKVTTDIPVLKFNTAIASLMEFTNDWKELGQKTQPETSTALLTHQDLRKLVKLFAPLTPFLAEEIWSQLGEKTTVHLQTWPEFSAELAQEQIKTIPVQVNGKVRGELKIEASVLDKMTQEQVVQKVQLLPTVSRWLKHESGQDKSVKKAIYVKNKIVSLVV